MISVYLLLDFVAPLLRAIVFGRGHVTDNKRTHAARRFCRRFGHCSFLRITVFASFSG